MESIAALAQLARDAKTSRPQTAGLDVPSDFNSGPIAAKGWSEFPRPNAQTQAWLAARIPGLNISQLRVVPLDAADRMMRRAVAAQATYLDLLSDPIFRQGNAEVYYVPQDVLERLDRHYVSGALPAVGTATDGRPFRMQALVAGGGYANFLYDQTAGFSFKDGDNEIKIGDAGNVSARIRGPADIALQGIAGCGCVFIFCGCADIQAMTKVSDSKIIVQTSRGPQNQDISPIRARAVGSIDENFISSGNGSAGE